MATCIVAINKLTNKEIPDNVLKIMLKDGVVFECKSMIQCELTQRKLIEIGCGWRKDELLNVGVTSSWVGKEMSIRIKDGYIKEISHSIRTDWGLYYIAFVGTTIREKDEIIEF